METTIYMPLLNKGTDVWRPVEAEELGNGRYRGTGLPPGEEEWALPTAAIVVIDAPPDRFRRRNLSLPTSSSGHSGSRLLHPPFWQFVCSPR